MAGINLADGKILTSTQVKLAQAEYARLDGVAISATVSEEVLQNVKAAREGRPLAPDSDESQFADEVFAGYKEHRKVLNALNSANQEFHFLEEAEKILDKFGWAEARKFLASHPKYAKRPKQLIGQERVTSALRQWKRQCQEKSQLSLRQLSFLTRRSFFLGSRYANR